MAREDLLALRIQQLERRQEDIDIATNRLKNARLKNKESFDKKHRLRPKDIEEGDWVLVYDSSLDNQYTAMRKMVKRWFGPYIVMHVFDNATYKLCELDGTEVKGPIAGKRIKLFKTKGGEIADKGITPDIEIGEDNESDEETLEEGPSDEN